MKTLIIAVLALFLASGVVFAQNAQTRTGTGQGQGNGTQTQNQTRTPGQCK